MPSGIGHFTVSLYAWWEHPKYLEARTSGKQWRITAGSDANRRVTVYPKNISEARITSECSVVHWEFLSAHPFLWHNAEEARIICNEPMTAETWSAVMDTAKENMTTTERNFDLSKYASLTYSSSRSFCLGSFPKPLFTGVTEALKARGIPFISSGEPKAPPPRVLFLVDGLDYIIADDFEVDVPNFEHKPQWCEVLS